MAHPKLVEIARVAFDDKLGDKPNQKDVLKDEVMINDTDFLNIASLKGEVTEAGFRTNVNVALLYIESWLRGVGAAALYNLMEDAATAEISRAQLWQWIHHKVKLSGGVVADAEYYKEICRQEYQSIVKTFLAAGQDIDKLSVAKNLLDSLVLRNEFEEFLTIKAYPHIL